MTFNKVVGRSSRPRPTTFPEIIPYTRKSSDSAVIIDTLPFLARFRVSLLIPSAVEPTE